MTARKLQFAGALFDGKSARKHPVDIELTPREIILNNPGHEPIHWLYPNIRWAANNTNPFYIEQGEINSESMETLVVEDPNFYNSISKIAPDSFFAAEKKAETNWKIYVAGLLVLIFSAYVLSRLCLSFWLAG
jgi:hypothetical protein